MQSKTLKITLPFIALYLTLHVQLCMAFTASFMPRNVVLLNKLSSTSIKLTKEEIQLDTKNSVEHSLIELSKEIINYKSGFYSDYEESVFSEEFVFRGPYIGPLNKKDYFSTMDTFKIYEAIPDISPNAFGFSIDPQDPNRVWFLVRNTGTFNGKPGLGLGKDINFPSNGATLEGCTETFSMTYDENQKLKYLTVGYVADRFEGNTGGKGAAVGIFHAIGFPFPSPGPLLKFAQWFGTEVYNVGPISYSVDNIPSWWKSEAKASDGYL